MNETELLTQLNETPPSDDLINAIHSYVPGWIEDVADEYASDYTFLSNSWQTFCDMLRVPKQKIVMVTSVEPYTDENAPRTTSQTACDLLTSKGYCVRRTTEFLPCLKCGKALATEALRRKLKTHPLHGPKIRGSWSDLCSVCKLN